MKCQTIKCDGFVCLARKLKVEGVELIRGRIIRRLSDCRTMERCGLRKIPEVVVCVGQVHQMPGIAGFSLLGD